MLVCPVYEHELWHTILKRLVETRLKRWYLTSWVGGSTRAILFVSRLQSQSCVWTPDFFFSAHTEQKVSGPWGDILWIWQKVYCIRVVDYTFNCVCLIHLLELDEQIDINLICLCSVQIWNVQDMCSLAKHKQRRYRGAACLAPSKRLSTNSALIRAEKENKTFVF